MADTTFIITVDGIPTTIPVRDCRGSYHARCHGKTASCTWGAKVAAWRAAVKFFGPAAEHAPLREVRNPAAPAAEDAESATTEERNDGTEGTRA